jgi:hypothetical protein
MRGRLRQLFFIFQSVRGCFIYCFVLLLVFFCGCNKQEVPERKPPTITMQTTENEEASLIAITFRNGESGGNGLNPPPSWALPAPYYSFTVIKLATVEEITDYKKQLTFLLGRLEEAREVREKAAKNQKSTKEVR